MAQLKPSVRKLDPEQWYCIVRLPSLVIYIGTSLSCAARMLRGKAVHGQGPTRRVAHARAMYVANRIRAIERMRDEIRRNRTKAHTA